MSNIAKANDLAVRSMSMTINLYLNDPTDKYSPSPHWLTDRGRDGLFVMPHTTKLRHALFDQFKKYIPKQKDPNGLDKQVSPNDEYLTFYFRGLDIQAFRDMIAFLLDEGFVEKINEKNVEIESCIHCGSDEPAHRFTGNRHAVVCSNVKCIETIASLV